jgi:16S rRNA (cytosine1402-N4)-methyltransferase
MLNEMIEGLNLRSNINVVDCTLGDAGHSEAILEKTGPEGRLLGIDADPESVLRAKQYLYRYGTRAVFARSNFSDLKQAVSNANFGPVHGILFDLGWSTPQFAERGRGFSFETDEPLDMRYSGEQPGAPTMTAADIVNTYEKKDLERILRQFGEEKFAAAIADKIVRTRAEAKIEKTGQLTEIILKVFREKLDSKKDVPWTGGIHPVTKVFQALRIETNKELKVLKDVLPDATELLTSGGRIAIITFHSLEDRIVKHFFQANSDKLKIITKKPIVASEAEQKANPRSRSAKLRVAEKI